MTDSKPERPPLDEETCRQFSALVLLHQITSKPDAFHAGLLDGDDSLLEPIFDYMMKLDLVTVGENDFYQPTVKGEEAYNKLLHQQRSYLIHYDVYGAVDLAEGEFGDPENDELDAPNWSDLRVAVAEYKKIDPYRTVFLSMLADEAFFGNPDWKFDIVLGSSFYKGLEEIVRSQIAVWELGYQEEDGSEVSGETVLEDVILQGARINKERLDRERQRQTSLFEEEQEEARQKEERDSGDYDDGDYDRGGYAYMPYDPWMPMGGYMGSPLFVEALWLSAFW